MESWIGSSHRFKLLNLPFFHYLTFDPLTEYLGVTPALSRSIPHPSLRISSVIGHTGQRSFYNGPLVQPVRCFLSYATDLMFGESNSSDTGVQWRELSEDIYISLLFKRFN